MTKELFKTALLQFLNEPYRWGGDDPINGFDCSGAAQEWLAMIGLDPVGDQSAQALYLHFKMQSREGARDTGSLAFYGQSLGQITHVAMLIDSETIIEFGGGGSKTTSLEAAALQNAYCRLRPFNHRKDLVAVVNPKGLPW